MIQSFADKRTEEVFEGRVPRGLPTDILGRALAKLQIINNSQNLNDLRSPPGNRLEALVGNRAGQHSIRINDQWRVCFVWKDDNHAYEVEIVDYH